MGKPRVLIAHPFLSPSGGGNAVAAWALEALRDEFDVTLGTLAPVDYEAVNRNFGTSLRPEDFAVRVAPMRWRAIERWLPTRGALLRQCITMRWARKLDAERRFDALLSTENEMDFGRPGLQYIHYPWAFQAAPRETLRWFHFLPGLLQAYRELCLGVSGFSMAGMKENLSFANSEFVAGRIRKVHGMPTTVLYPPVPGGFPRTEWRDRVCGMVALGRMDPVKRWERAVEILELVRGRGREASLTLISNRWDVSYAARMEALAATRPWFRILYDLPRGEMVKEVARHRYGLHVMEGEHFGIAPAELQRAGCVAFVHRSGGPMEIVGAREDLMFSDNAEACERICRVMADGAMEEELRNYAAGRAECFTEERFCGELRAHVRAAVAGRLG